MLPSSLLMSLLVFVVGCLLSTSCHFFHVLSESCPRPLPIFEFINEMGYKGSGHCPAFGSSIDQNVTVHSIQPDPAKQFEEPKKITLLQWFAWQAAQNSFPAMDSASVGTCLACSPPDIGHEGMKRSSRQTASLGWLMVLPPSPQLSRSSF